MEIARQKPDATRVAGLYAWNQLKRRVKKGERGIRILAIFAQRIEKVKLARYRCSVHIFPVFRLGLSLAASLDS
jgi:hypothetical protein